MAVDIGSGGSWQGAVQNAVTTDTQQSICEGRLGYIWKDNIFANCGIIAGYKDTIIVQMINDKDINLFFSDIGMVWDFLQNWTEQIICK